MRKNYPKPFSVLEYGVMEAIRESDGAQDIIDGVAAVMMAALKDAGQMGNAMRDASPLIAAAVVRGGVKARGELCYVARGFMAGLLRASGFTAARARELIGVAASSLLLNAQEAGADSVEVSRCLVEGAIVWAAEVDEDQVAAASAAARAAYAAASVLSEEAGRKVHDALKDGVAGVDVLFDVSAQANF